MKRIIRGLFIQSYLFSLPLVSFASGSTGGGGGSTGGGGGSTGGGGGSTGTLINPLNANSVCGFLKDVLNIVMQIAMPIALLFLVLAGFQLVAARGNPEALTKARKNLIYTIIGIGLFLGAWTLALVLANTINALGSSLGQPNSVGTC